MTSTACAQCGQTQSTVVYRIRRRSARYWCRRCGAVGTIGAIPLAQPDLAPAPPVAAQDPALALDKAQFYKLYDQTDRAAGHALPAVSKVVHALHQHCYRADLATDSLIRPGDDLTALRARVEHVRGWLAHGGRDLCWVINRHNPADPPAAEVTDAAKSLLAGEKLTAEAAKTLRLALFAADAGPQLPPLLARVFTDAETQAAVDAYLQSGARPLRAATLAALDTSGHDRRFARGLDEPPVVTTRPASASGAPGTPPHR